MGTYGVIDFDDEEIEAASHWYGGQGSMLYAITSTGSLKRGTIRPRNDDGTPMTDEEWIVYLATNLEGEAESAADDAAKQAKKAKGDEKKALIADRDGLRSIAFKAARFVRDAEKARKAHGEKWITTRHLSGHATKKKTAAQLDREIDQTVGKRIERKKLGEMMGPWGSDFSYGQGSGAIGAVSSYYYSDKKYPDRKWVETALAAIEADIPKAEHGAHGWTKADANQLRRIAQGLRYYLNTDYKDHAIKGRSTRAHATRSRSNWPDDVKVGDEVYAVVGGRRHGPGVVEDIYDDGTMRVDFTQQFAGRKRIRPQDLIFVP
jgi:hypothetical protein